MESKGKKQNHILLYIFLLLMSFIILFPISFGFISSFRHLDEIFKYISPITIKTFFTTDLTLDAYKNLFIERNFGRILFNTFFVTIATVMFSLFLCSLAAFSFAVFEFKGKSLLFGVVLVSFMIPEEIIAIPLYSIVDKLGLINTYSALILPGIANGLVIFLYRQFFLDLPAPLLEAARMDGASWFRIYSRIF